MSKANEDARKLQQQAKVRVANRHDMSDLEFATAVRREVKTAQQIPTGFVPQDSTDLDPGGNFGGADELVSQGYTSMPVTLYTDMTGSNYFAIESGDETHWLPLRTD